MLRRPVLIAALIILVAVLSYLDVLAFKYFWYWRLWWFDILMHFLGGVLLGMGGLWLYALSTEAELKLLSASRMIGVSLLAAVVFGLIWEFFEFGVDHFYMAKVGFKSLQALQLGFGDSVGDLGSDIAGGLSAGLIIGIILRWKQKQLN